jgi:hypothetical protein
MHISFLYLVLRKLNTVTCIRAVTVRWSLDWMIGFIVLIHSARNYKQL